MNTHRVDRICAHTHKKRSIIEKCDFRSHIIFTTKIAFISPRDRIGDVNMINTLKTYEKVSTSFGGDLVEEESSFAQGGSFQK
jgi:hypothetical protein